MTQTVIYYFPLFNLPTEILTNKIIPFCISGDGKHIPRSGIERAYNLMRTCKTLHNYVISHFTNCHTTLNNAAKLHILVYPIALSLRIMEVCLTNSKHEETPDFIENPHLILNYPFKFKATAHQSPSFNFIPQIKLIKHLDACLMNSLKLSRTSLLRSSKWHSSFEDYLDEYTRLNNKHFLGVLLIRDKKLQDNLLKTIKILTPEIDLELPGSPGVMIMRRLLDIKLSLNTLLQNQIPLTQFHKPHIQSYWKFNEANYTFSNPEYNPQEEQKIRKDLTDFTQKLSKLIDELNRKKGRHINSFLKVFGTMAIFLFGSFALFGINGLLISAITILFLLCLLRG